MVAGSPPSTPSRPQENRPLQTDSEAGGTFIQGPNGKPPTLLEEGKIEPHTSLRPVTFSIQTCLELLRDNKLGTEQINRESKLILDPEVFKDMPRTVITDEPTGRVTRSQSLSQTLTPVVIKRSIDARVDFKRDKLLEFFGYLVDSNLVNFRDSITCLTSNLAREIEESKLRVKDANEQLEQLKLNISSAQDILLQSKSPTQNSRSLPASWTTNPVVEPPYTCLEQTNRLKRFDLDSLCAECDFNVKHANRSTAYYGEEPYA